MKKECTFLACLFSVLGAYAWDGEGTQTAPYQLSSAQDIVELGEYYDTGNHEPAWFVMTQDIDMKGIIMSPVSGVFNGFIDGQNHEITNLVIVTENGEAALFSEIRDGSIRNLTIASGYIESNGSAAALALTMNNSQMTNCINNATVISNGRYANNVGGLVATGVSSVIRNCVNRGLVMATGENSSNVGGIVGSTNGTETIDLCANYGTVSGTETIGGIVGALGSNDELYNSYNMGFVSGATTVGGVVGTQSTPLIAENDGSYVYMCWNGGRCPVISLWGESVVRQSLYVIARMSVLWVIWLLIQVRALVVSMATVMWFIHVILEMYMELPELVAFPEMWLLLSLVSTEVMFTACPRSVVLADV